MPKAWRQEFNRFGRQSMPSPRDRSNNRLGAASIPDFQTAKHAGRAGVS